MLELLVRNQSNSPPEEGKGKVKKNCIAKQKRMYFCFKWDMRKCPKSTDNMVLSRIYGRGRGVVYTPAHFQDLGSPTAVRLALMRHSRAGIM